MIDIASLFRKDYKIRETSGGYERAFGGVVVKSKHLNTLKNTFDNILKNKIYDFDSKKSCPVIIDGGANIGLGILSWKLKYPKAKIKAFEPSREVVTMLCENLERNKITDVEVYELALYDRVTSREFTSNEALSGSLIMEKNLPNRYFVRTTCLSEHITEEVDLLKLDIEGVELMVLDEIKHKLAFVKRIFVEYHSFQSQPQELSELLSILQKAGFRYYLNAEYQLTTPFRGFKSSLGQDLQVNIWAVKKDV